MDLDAISAVAGGARIENLQRLSGGASRETWSFDAGGRGMILRRADAGDPRPGIGMTAEAALLRAAADAGVPVPAVVASGENPDGSSFVVMERIEGETIPRKILRDTALEGARAGLAAQCGQALARIHTIDPIAALSPQDPLAWCRATLDASGAPHPAFELAIRWLAERRPPPPASPRVVHGDFRNGNLIVGDDGLRAVLDWELAHLGDPLEDLGWLCVKAWRFSSPLPVGGFGSVEDLVSAYEAASGTTVDRDAMAWWIVMGTLRWGVICIVQCSAHLSGGVRSVELAAIGRRVCEVEYDLLELVS